tara:strand:+ start:7695 stop:7937 length:243 start_codon:yes stop_codon:yes gene_type:complete
MVKITILNETGHTELTLSANEALDQIIDHPTHWAYVDGELVTREEITNIDFNQVDEVVLAQAIVGGSDDELDEGDESDGN